MQVTFFKNFSDILNPHQTSLVTALDRIKNGASKDRILEIRRKLVAEEDFEADKKALPCVVFSAAKTKLQMSRKDYETHREDSCVTEHSGLFTLDFDKCDVPVKIEQLKKDPYILAVWKSVTGNGVRALVKCPASIENHNLYYTAFLERYPDLDSTSRNISRVAFESYDPDIFINWNSLSWDKKLTEEQRRVNKEKTTNKRSNKIMSIAVGMVRASYDGKKHESLRNAAVLLGGYISTGRVDENEAIKVLEEEIRAKNPKDFSGAQSTIRDGIDFGKSRPLHESKDIEKEQKFLRREDGSYDFLADDQEMTEYELAVINGTLEMGLPTGFNSLNNHWMFKKNTLVWVGAIDNVGKSFVIWYLAVLAAKLHNWKIVINSNENGDGQIRKKLKEFYIGKSIKLMDDEELTIAHEWVRDHFRIMTSKQLHTIEEWLKKAEVLYDEGFEFDVLIGDPFNSYDTPTDIDMHRLNLKSLNLLRVFKENFSSVWICDHVNSAAARKKDKDGYVEAPWKSDIEYGQLKANKVDDFIMLHRLVNHPEKKHLLEVHVHKIKDRETGGCPTAKDEPVILQMNQDFCGFTSNGIDPLKHRRI